MLVVIAPGFIVAKDEEEDWIECLSKASVEELRDSIVVWLHPFAQQDPSYT